MKYLRRLASIFSVLAATLMLAGCKYTLMDPKGTIAASEKELLIDAVLLMLIVVIPVILINFWFAWRYRASNKKATYKPDDHTSTTIEVICWTIPIIIIAILGVMTWISTHKLDPYRPLDTKGKPVVIQAVALNWKWLFIYPKQNIATVNYVRLPVNRQVKFLITSDAPMNSFVIPRLAGQIYAMGGMQTKLHILATHKGSYTGRSTNFSGGGFSGMHFKADVTSQQDFNNWVRQVKRSRKTLSVPVYNQLMKDSENNPVTYYSSVADGLFHKIIMKFMKPDAAMETAADGTKIVENR